MPLPEGTEFPPYRLMTPLGSGGIGTVYRAMDTQLGRVVAIKVLNAGVAADTAQLERFQQEARTLASLSHANILAVYGIGTHDGMPYIVSELLEGETLRDRLSKGPLPARRANEVALAVARGLAAAHGRGIVHRDLKPENIFLTRDGQIKILDFGLAKLVQPGTDTGDDTLLHSLGGGATTPGMVLGTVGYMSPEQVRGEQAGPAADIFSFGAVLYEMLTGNRAFKRASAVESMAAVLKENPPELSVTGTTASPGMQRIVERCLEKDPEQRFHSASDLAFAISALAEPSTSGTPSSIQSGGVTAAAQQAVAATRSRRGSSFWIAATLCGLVLFALGGLAAKKYFQPPIRQFKQLTFKPGVISYSRFTRDGQTVLFSGQIESDPMAVYSIRTSLLQPMRVNVPNALLYAVSKNDEMALGTSPVIHSHYYTGQLSTAAITGGMPRPLQDDVVSADYLPDGTTLALTRMVNGACSLEFPAGTPLFSGPGYLDYIRVNPDGEHAAFVEHDVEGDDRGFLVVIDRKGNRRQLSPAMESIQGVVWAHDGKHIIFTGAPEVGGNSMYSIYRTDLSGNTEQIMGLPGLMMLNDISSSGELLMNSLSTMLRVGAVDAAGKETSNLGIYDSTTVTGISPDGKAMALLDYSAPTGTLYEVAFRKTDGSPPLILGPGSRPQISPDGKSVATTVFRTPLEVAIYPIGAGDTKRIVLHGLSSALHVNWFADGKAVFVEGSEANSSYRTYKVTIASGSVAPVGPDHFIAALASPDGKSLLGRLNGAWMLLDLASGKTRAAMGGAVGNIVRNANAPPSGEDVVTGWSRDGKSVFVCVTESGKGSAYKVNVETGEATLLTTYSPKDSAGLMSVLIFMAQDEKSYVYNTETYSSTLFILDGIE